MNPDQRTTRARVAALKRHHPHDPKTGEVAAAFRADRLAEHIERIVHQAPPLTQSQRDRLALLLRAPVSS